MAISHSFVWEKRTCICLKFPKAWHKTRSCRSAPSRTPPPLPTNVAKEHLSYFDLRVCRTHNKRITPNWQLIQNLCTSQIKASTPPRAYPRHLTPFLAREGGNLITTHRGWGIWSLASMSCYETSNFDEFKGKDWMFVVDWLKTKGSKQAVFCIWRCLRTIYFCSI